VGVLCPYRRGQGLSAEAGPYIGDQIAKAVKDGGIHGGEETMIRLLETDHLNDQLAGSLVAKANLRSSKPDCGRGQFVWWD